MAIFRRNFVSAKICNTMVKPGLIESHVLGFFMEKLPKARDVWKAKNESKYKK